MHSQHDQVHSRSLKRPEEFWAEAAQQIAWYKTWDKVLDGNEPFYRRFTGGVLNTCYNALDRHVENGRAEQTALIYDSPVTNTIESFSFRDASRGAEGHSDRPVTMLGVQVRRFQCQDNRLAGSVASDGETARIAAPCPPVRA
jgi:Acetyl-coenzyme A synthetase N-terminus